MAKAKVKQQPSRSSAAFWDKYIKLYDKLEVQRSDSYEAYLKDFGPIMDEQLAKRGIKPPKP